MKLLLVASLCVVANGSVLMDHLVDKLDGKLPNVDVNKVLDALRDVDDSDLLQYAPLHQAKPKISRKKLIKAVEKELMRRPDLRKNVVRAINHMDDDALIAFADKHATKHQGLDGNGFDGEPKEKEIKSVFDMDGNPLIDDDDDNEAIDKMVTSDDDSAVEDAVDDSETKLEKLKELMKDDGLMALLKEKMPVDVPEAVEEIEAVVTEAVVEEERADVTEAVEEPAVFGDKQKLASALKGIMADIEEMRKDHPIAADLVKTKKDIEQLKEDKPIVADLLEEADTPMGDRKETVVEDDKPIVADVKDKANQLTIAASKNEEKPVIAALKEKLQKPTDVVSEKETQRTMSALKEDAVKKASLGKHDKTVAYGLKIRLPKGIDVDEWLAFGLLDGLDFDIVSPKSKPSIYHIGAGVDDLDEGVASFAKAKPFLSAAKAAAADGFSHKTDGGDVCYGKNSEECLPLYGLMKIALELENGGEAESGLLSGFGIKSVLKAKNSN